MLDNKDMKTFFKELLSDETGAYSSKRLGGLLCVLALVTSLIAAIHLLIYLTTNFLTIGTLMNGTDFTI